MTHEAKLSAALFLLSEVTSISDLAMYTDLSSEEVIAALKKLKDIYIGLGLQILEDKEGIQLVTMPALDMIAKSIRQKELSGDLSPAALQVMTIVAYMPGSTRSDISYVRGAQSGASIRNLIMRGLVYKKDERCFVTNEALMHLSVSRAEDLPDFEKLNAEFKNKLAESLQFES